MRSAIVGAAIGIWAAALLIHCAADVQWKAGAHVPALPEATQLVAKRQAEMGR
jgi:hypothetical protein